MLFKINALNGMKKLKKKKKIDRLFILLKKLICLNQYSLFLEPYLQAYCNEITGEISGPL